MVFGFLNPALSTLFIWITPILSGLFLALTGALLIWDLEHPNRFYLIFARPQWKSWLVKGAFIIAGYSLVLLVHFIAIIAGSRAGVFENLMQNPGAHPLVTPGAAQFLVWLTVAGLPLGIMTAVYTAYLFAQAKARDMWQNPLLPPHLLVQVEEDAREVDRARDRVNRPVLQMTTSPAGLKCRQLCR